MSKEESLNIRRKKRYSHIYIRLNIKIENNLKWIKALDWNEIGFNFSLDCRIEDKEIEFRKGPSKFRGSIVWHRDYNNDYAVMETILNTMLFEELKKMKNTKETLRRFIVMLRSQDRIMEKKKLLSAFNREISDEDMNMQIEKHKKEHPLYRYGVKVESDIWTGIVNYAIDASSVIHAVDNIGKKLSEINNAV